MPAWNPNLRSKTAIRSSDTRYFVDPSIAAAAIGIGPEDLLSDLKTFDFLFETLCVRDLRVFADALGGSVYHYRDKDGLECDAVIHLRNGTYGFALLRKYAQGSELSDAEMRAISGTCTTYFKLSYASRRIASFYYEWTWDHCPLSPLNDSVAIEWTAYGYDGDTVDLIVERKFSSIAYYWETEPKDDFRYSVPGELETNLSFDGLCLKVPVLGESDIGSGVPAVFYAKTGYVGVDLKVDESVSRDIYFIQASGLYGHTQVGIGFPSVSLTNGKLSFGGNLSVNEIGRRKVEIYNDGTIKYV